TPATLAIAAGANGGADKNEGNSGTTPFTFTVTRGGDTTSAVTANFAVTGSAVTGADFQGGTLPRGTVSFAAGETTKTITVNVAGDTSVEQAEAFTVTLSNATNGASITTASATGTIRNDDAGAFTIQSLVALPASDSANSVQYAATVSRTTNVASAVSTKLDISPTNVNSQVIASKEIHFAAGETEKKVFVDVQNSFRSLIDSGASAVMKLLFGDTILSKTLSLAPASANKPNYTLTTAVSVEDTLPTGVANVSDNMAKIKGNNLEFVLFSNTESVGDVKFTYELTFNGNEMGEVNVARRDDFKTVSGEGVIKNGTKSQIISIPINEDLVDEGVEYAKLTVNIVNPSGANISLSANGYIIDNDMSAQDIQGFYMPTNKNNYSDFGHQYDYDADNKKDEVHTGLDVNTTLRETDENDLKSPVYGAVVSHKTDPKVGFISVILPTMFTNGDIQYVKFGHMTEPNSQASVGSLIYTNMKPVNSTEAKIGTGSTLGDFNPEGFDNHMHIEYSNNNGPKLELPPTQDIDSKWQIVNDKNIATDPKNIANLAALNILDPKVAIAIAQHMVQWQDSLDTITLGAFGPGSPRPNGKVFSYMDTLSQKNGTGDLSDKLKFFITETTNFTVRLVWNNDNDDKRELSLSIDGVSPKQSDQNTGIWSPNGISINTSPVNSEYDWKTYTLAPGEYTLNIVGSSLSDGDTPYWLNIALG
ncbi:MAG: Calx-beta domain-containing protein, partial [Niveispirillum sp.]|uniref:Calx-beta domain-containing protein n=1 Tax=Niveispirillum sp. TaxID=1917217 RepID=UPI003BA52DC0